MIYTFVRDGKAYEYTVETQRAQFVTLYVFSPVDATARIDNDEWILTFNNGMEISGVDDTPFEALQRAYEKALHLMIEWVDALRGPTLAYLTHEEIIENLAGEFDLCDANGKEALSDDMKDWVKGLNLNSIAAMLTTDPSIPAKIGIYIDLALDMLGLYTKFAAQFGVERPVAQVHLDDEEDNEDDE